MSPDQLNGRVMNINIYYFLGNSQTSFCSYIVLTLTFSLPPTELGGVCLGQQESILILDLKNVLLANIIIILTQRLRNLTI